MLSVIKPIVGYEVVRDPSEQPAAAEAGSSTASEVAGETNAKKKTGEVIQIMHEALERPEHLIGVTYKVKTPVSDHATYITINDVVLNAGTAHEIRRPFEIFVNSKNLDHYQWVVALTRLASAVFRKGGDVSFMVGELKAVFDPRGGYWKPGGKFMPSEVAEIGEVIERHLIDIGLMEPPELDEAQKRLIAAKRAEFEAASKQTDAFAESADGDFPPGAALCAKCNTRAAVFLDGCMTCLNCGDSKCG